VDVPVAQEMLAAMGPRLADLKAAIDSTRQPQSRELGLQVRVDVMARYHERQPSANVVGVLEGADPELRDQYLVIGAHLDHVGSQGGIYFPGANDNASGAAAVMAIAEAFARGGARPRRSIIFTLLSSEESGLQGATHFVEHPPVPLGKIVAYFNLDCIGHGDSIQVGSGKTSPKLWRLARELDAGGARLTVEETWGGGGADATPFAEKKIPTLYFASRFSYTHLHQPGDTPATLNPRLYEALARLVYRTAWKVAEGGYSGE
jgi:Zn-dependent M28 family amino/carboxypeptidase